MFPDNPNSRFSYNLDREIELSESSSEHSFESFPPCYNSPRESVVLQLYVRILDAITWFVIILSDFNDGIMTINDLRDQIDRLRAYVRLIGDGIYPCTLTSENTSPFKDDEYEEYLGTKEDIVYMVYRPRFERLLSQIASFARDNPMRDNYLFEFQQRIVIPRIIENCQIMCSDINSN